MYVTSSCTTTGVLAGDEYILYRAARTKYTPGHVMPCSGVCAKQYTTPLSRGLIPRGNLAAELTRLKGLCGDGVGGSATIYLGPMEPHRVNGPCGLGSPARQRGTTSLPRPPTAYRPPPATGSLDRQPSLTHMLGSSSSLLSNPVGSPDSLDKISIRTPVPQTRPSHTPSSTKRASVSSLFFAS